MRPLLARVMGWLFGYRILTLRENDLVLVRVTHGRLGREERVRMQEQLKPMTMVAPNVHVLVLDAEIGDVEVMRGKVPSWPGV